MGVGSAEHTRDGKCSLGREGGGSDATGLFAIRRRALRRSSAGFLKILSLGSNTRGEGESPRASSIHMHNTMRTHYKRVRAHVDVESTAPVA